MRMKTLKPEKIMSIYKLALKIPILGTIIYIANCYAYSGDSRSTKEFANPYLWLKKLIFPFLLAAILTTVTLWPLAITIWETKQFSAVGLSKFALSPGDTILTIIPSLLGFGIGVYALIFALANPIIKELQNSINILKDLKKRNHGSALVINSDLAFPLTILTISIVVGVFQKGNDSLELTVTTWWIFWYAITTTFEVIGVLFGLGDQALLEKMESKQD